MNDTINIDSLKKDMREELKNVIQEDMAKQLSRLNMLWSHQIDMATYDKDHADYQLIPAIKAIKDHCRIDVQQKASGDGYNYSISLITDGLEMDEYLANLIDIMWSNTEKTAAYTV